MTNDNPLLTAICILKDGNSLNELEISSAFRVIMNGDAHDGLIGAFLGLLASRVPTGKELAGASIVMKECVDSVSLPDPSTLLDTCGTGGAPKTFNVSTAAGIVAASCGVRVAKHGNRSRTGRGSAEVLEQLGINLDASKEQQVACLEGTGICFCFAPKHHRAVAHVMPVRKELGFPTIFNLLGPLTNPCSAGRQLLGVWDNSFVEPVAEALRSSGTIKSVVVHSYDGLDEISISAPTRLCYVEGDSIVEDVVDPESTGLRYWERKDVVAIDLQDAVEKLKGVLVEGQDGAPRDMILLNSAIALCLANRVERVDEGVSMAAAAIDSGQTKETIERWSELSHTHVPSTDE